MYTQAQSDAYKMRHAHRAGCSRPLLCNAPTCTLKLSSIHPWRLIPTLLGLPSTSYTTAKHERRSETRAPMDTEHTHTQPMPCNTATGLAVAATLRQVLLLLQQQVTIMALGLVSSLLGYGA
mmetsp:Transcript_25454/g.65513  ORF Transcript_25454/g.65513 Transcript_25454/m.65513 type:complete len:122 (-) Transcript_25454:1100-1465(-)